MIRKTHPTDIVAKKAAGEAAAQFVEDGMLVGLGTGSTSTFFIAELGRRCREEGLQIKAVATSKQSAHQAEMLGIALEENQNVSSLDLTVDGADEIDPQKNMVKGGGGALFREKLLAKSSGEMIVIVDENKLVDRLGAFPLPVEFSSFVYRTTLARLENKGYQGLLRLNGDQSIYTTDNGNYIFDIKFESPILDPEKIQLELKSIEGVVETGLFLGMAGRVIIGYQSGHIKIQA
jgi:ribose 5-phosphate isomerase A